MSHGLHQLLSSATVTIPASPTLVGNLTIPETALGVVVFAHGSGSSRLSPRNQSVATQLHGAGFATLLFDLLTAEEEMVDAQTGHLRFDVEMLAGRLARATRWLFTQRETYPLPVGYFGASTGAAAALIAAAQLPGLVHAIVSRGGRPDLAGAHLKRVRAPTLLIVGGADTGVIDLNRDAFRALAAPEKELRLVPGATHLFDEPGTLEQVATIAEEWFRRYLPPQHKNRL
jgi:putative phosphoribosyl transferase